MMQKITHKNFEIYKIEDAPQFGDYSAKFFHIKNQETNNTFFYTVKISGTVQAIEQINTEKSFINTALPYVMENLDKNIEKSEHPILITTYTQEEKKKGGIFYTPQEVIRFIFDILSIWKTEEDKKTGRWTSKKHFPSVIDPSVGEGAFLKIACEVGFTKPDWVFGLDIDENAVKKWKEINLLEEFGGKNKDLEAHFFHQNGLEPIKWNQHIKKYKYKLKQVNIQNQQFDTVVGNPPYGGVGLGESELTDDLISQLSKFEILPENVRNVLGFANSQVGLFMDDKSLAVKPEAKKRLQSFPIEILFIERFIQLAKPCGWIAVIIPDGVLANSNSDYVRKFIANRTKVEAIISLPRETFKNVGTNAKTSILFLRKLEEGEKISRNYPVFLASVEKIKAEYFQSIANSYKNFYNEGII